MGAAFAWSRGGSWHSRRFHLGNKKVFDAEVFAIYQALKASDEAQESGHYTIFADSGGDPAGSNGCGRARPVLGEGSHRGLLTPGGFRQRGEGLVGPCLLRRHGKRDGRPVRQGGGQRSTAQGPGPAAMGGQSVAPLLGVHGEPFEGYGLVGLSPRQARAKDRSLSGPGFWRRPLRRVRKSLTSRYYSASIRACGHRLFPAREGDGATPEGVQRLQVVRQRKERVATPYFRRVQGLGPPDPEAVAAGGQGLRMEASKGAGGAGAVEGGSHRGCFRVPGGCASRVLAGGESKGAR